jgi:hypothetical protein
MHWMICSTNLGRETEAMETTTVSNLKPRFFGMSSRRQSILVFLHPARVTNGKRLCRRYVGGFCDHGLHHADKRRRRFSRCQGDPRRTHGPVTALRGWGMEPLNSHPSPEGRLFQLSSFLSLQQPEPSHGSQVLHPPRYEAQTHPHARRGVVIVTGCSSGTAWPQNSEASDGAERKLTERAGEPVSLSQRH